MRISFLTALFCFHTALASAGQSVPPLSPVPTGPLQLSRVAYFPTEQITGVAVTRSGRLFVAIPRLSVDVPTSVGEVVDGKIVPYPNAAWNAYRNANGAANLPGEQFVSAQAVVMDHDDMLWVVDAAAPNRTGPVQGGVKLVKINPATNAVERVIRLTGSTTPPKSSINDVRFSPDGRFAYLSDVGEKGAIVVVHLGNGQSWRVLEGAPSTQYDPSAQIMAEGKPLLGRDGKPLQLNIDGIALSADGKTFYWQALTGKTVYSLPTAVLNEPKRARNAAPKVVAATHPADGLWIDAAGRFFVTNPSENTIEVAEHVGAPLRLLAKDEAMRWPDSFAQAADGSLYISASFIGDSPWFNPSATTTPSAIFRLSPVSALQSLTDGKTVHPRTEQ